MSSHHFVKEGQEPALIVHDFIDFELAGSLLEWAPLVIATEKSVDHLLNRSIKMDVVIGGNAEVLKQKVADQTPVKLIQTVEDVLAVALYYIISIKQKAAVIITANPEEVVGRLKEFHGRLEISIVSNKQKWSLIHSNSFSKWLARDATLSYVSEAPVTVDGKKHAGQTISGDDCLVHLRSDGPFWIIEDL